MRILAVSVLVFPLTLAIGATAATLPQDTELQAQKAEAALGEAQIHHDRAVLEKMVDAHYVLIKSSGARQGKCSFIDTMTNASLRLHSFQTEDAFAVRIDPNVVILAGLMTMTGAQGGATFVERFRFSDVWRRRAGKWQIAFTQISSAPPDH